MNKHEDVIFIKQAELDVLLQCNKDCKVSIHPVEHKQSTWWKVIFTFNHSLKKHILLNKLGDIRLFKKIDSVVNFIDNVSSKTKSFTVFLT